MRKLIMGLAALLVAAPISAGPVHVKGYVTKNGTYVAPHYRSSPDSSLYNNYSTRGNVNPYTGKAGTVNPYGSYSSPYVTPAPSYSNPYLSDDDDSDNPE